MRARSPSQVVAPLVVDLRASGRVIEARALHAHAFMPETQQEDDALVVGNDNEPVAVAPEADDAQAEDPDDAVTQPNPRISDEDVLPEHRD